MQARVVSMTKQYGKIAAVTYVSVGLGSWFLWYSVIKMGVDLKTTAEKYGIETDSEYWRSIETGGPVVGGYLLHKLSAPFRIPFTLALIPLVARVVGHVPK